jgi:hypothetical protein
MNYRYNKACLYRRNHKDTIHPTNDLKITEVFVAGAISDESDLVD